MVILTLNCGSSSVKYQVYDWDNKDILATGIVERVTLGGSSITHKARNKPDYVVEHECPTHTIAIELILNTLVDAEYGQQRYGQVKAWATAWFMRILFAFPPSTPTNSSPPSRTHRPRPPAQPGQPHCVEAARGSYPTFPLRQHGNAWHRHAGSSYMYALPQVERKHSTAATASRNPASSTSQARRRLSGKIPSRPTSSSRTSATALPSTRSRMAAPMTPRWALPLSKASSWAPGRATSIPASSST